jgi:parvulin-like peptidyl-prolyl isomerase
MAVTIVATQACSYFRKSDFVAVTAADLSALCERLPEQTKRMLAQNEGQRKQLIQTFKKAFSLAQAAEAEGLNKTEKYKQQLALSIDQLLANEYSKRNQEVTISKEEVDAYYASHKEGFETDFKVITEDQPAPSEEQKEMLKPRWGEMKIRADRARQAGVNKELGFVVQEKFSRANLLANLYTETLSDRFKPTAEEKNKYISEHPEADLEKLRQKAQDVLDRVKKGESFEKLADEINDDGTKGRGGDLDWFTRGKMDPDFEKAAFALEKGQVSSELVKSSFGYHIIRVDDKRKAAPQANSATPGAQNPAAPQQNGEPQEEVRARHIYVSTKEAEEFEQRLIDEKLKRALEDAELKYPVNAPTDFQVQIAGFDPNRIPPGIGGGQINPHENK